MGNPLFKRIYKKKTCQTWRHVFFNPLEKFYASSIGKNSSLIKRLVQCYTIDTINHPKQLF